MLLLSSCSQSSIRKEKLSDSTEAVLDTGLNYESGAKVVYVEYGSYFGECSANCTRMYRHCLTGNVTTMWTSLGDSYFSDRGTQYEFMMGHEAKSISDSFIRKIPSEIFNAKKTFNKIGCPDCTDGGGLYFRFLMDDGNLTPVIYKMEYDLNNATGADKMLGELIKSTLAKLEKYRK